MQPSSAAAERVRFSILANSFSSRQEAALEDYIQLSVMWQYNFSNIFFTLIVFESSCENYCCLVENNT